MARPRKSPELDAAQGNPSRRKSQTDRALLDQRRIAKLMQQHRPGEAFAEPPGWLVEFSPAGAQVWRDHAPALANSNRLASQFALTFGMFCYYAGEWLAACKDIKKNGYSQSVATIAGGTMERRRPSIDRREKALANVLSLSDAFGMTPIAMSSVLRSQSNVDAARFYNALQGVLRFDDEPAPEQPSETATAQTSGSAFASFDSEPPPGLIN